jgi:hypothetical protein
MPLELEILSEAFIGAAIAVHKEPEGIEMRKAGRQEWISGFDLRVFVSSFFPEFLPSSSKPISTHATRA